MNRGQCDSRMSGGLSRAGSRDQEARSKDACVRAGGCGSHDPDDLGLIREANNGSDDARSPVIDCHLVAVSARRDQMRSNGRKTQIVQSHLTLDDDPNVTSG